MSRRIIAFIDANEEMLMMLHPEDGIGVAFEKEMERATAAQGITVANWVISDNDDEVEFARYINYLFLWAMDHACDEVGSSPLTYEQWKERRA